MEPPARPDASLNASTNLVWDSIECWRKQVGQQLPGRSSGDAPLSVGVAQLQDGRQSRRHREIGLLEDKSMSRPDSALARGPETLVLYGMRPTVSVRVSAGGRRGASDTAV